MLCCGYTLTDFPISIRLTSLALWQSNDCPSASKATLMNMDKYFMWIHYERLHNHNKAKHNKTVCVFLGIYCITVCWTCVYGCMTSKPYIGFCEPIKSLLTYCRPLGGERIKHGLEVDLIRDPTQYASFAYRDRMINWPWYSCADYDPIDVPIQVRRISIRFSKLTEWFISRAYIIKTCVYCEQRLTE